MSIVNIKDFLLTVHCCKGQKTMILLLMVVKENFSRSQTDYDCYRYGTFQSGAHQLLWYVHVIFILASANQP